MLQVHLRREGDRLRGNREEMERDVTAMHEYGLWATLEKSRRIDPGPGGVTRRIGER